MKLIARKPCSFGGKQFYIDNEIPEELVADPAVQERLGVLFIVNADNEMLPDGQSGTASGQMFTQEQVDSMIAGVYEGTIPISVKDASDEENEQVMEIYARPEEIEQVFSIMQLNAEEGTKVIADVTNENVLILLHAADSRKTIKNAAKEQTGKLFSAGGDSNESGKGNASTGIGTEGADT